MDVNTVASHPTHFLRAVELIKEAREDYDIPSENWPSPLVYRYGMPKKDNYYCEVWVDGMDWQASYWILEQINTGEPRVRPLIVFENNSDRKKMEPTFSEVLDALFWYRRGFVWIKKDDVFYYSDTVWSFLHPVEIVKTMGILRKYFIQHASQPRVEFWLNEAFVPPQYRWRPRNERRKSINFGNGIAVSTEFGDHAGIDSRPSIPSQTA